MMHIFPGINQYLKRLTIPSKNKRNNKKRIENNHLNKRECVTMFHYFIETLIISPFGTQYPHELIKICKFVPIPQILKQTL